MKPFPTPAPAERRRYVFSIPGLPIAQPRVANMPIPKRGGGWVADARTGRPVLVKAVPRGHRIHEWRSRVTFFATVQVRKGLVVPFEKGRPVRLSVMFWYPRPSSNTYASRPNPAYAHVGKPDADNAIKAIKDALKGVLWHDDAQVAQYGRVEKWVAPPNGFVGCQFVVEDAYPAPTDFEGIPL